MTGNVHKRGNRWYVTIEMPRDPVTSRRRQKTHSGFRTRKEAEAARVRILADMQRGEYVEPSKRTVAQFFDEWKAATRATVRTSTWETNRRLVDRHVVPRLGSLLLQQVTPAHLNAFYADLGVGGLAPSSVVRVHAVIRKALADAVRWNLVTRNVADAADPPRLSRTQMKTWSARELRMFLRQVESERLYAAYVLACTTGMRRGEVLGLRWQDLDLEAGRASIAQTLIVVGGYEVQFSEPKTAKGRRMVALDPKTVTALGEHRERQLLERTLMGDAYEDADLVFAREDGTPLHPDSFSDAFWRHTKAAGLPRIRFHDLRHTHATLALAAGVHPKVVSERLGHASITITLDTYSHAIPAMQETAAELIASLVFEN